MTNGTEAVRERYAINGTMARVVAFLRERGIDPERPTYQDFFPFDQLHGRGVEATREHIKRAGISSNMHVLDLGCGVGGCSRVIAATCGCRVTAIDLTPELIKVARELTRSVGAAWATALNSGRPTPSPCRSLTVCSITSGATTSP